MAPLRGLSALRITEKNGAPFPMRRFVVG